ncbi:undecaprenyldiphospho-muramoylpentapeptide beta-N-acetylglucosaminyltransferase [Chlorobium phaeobacteroides]|uniref:UDP-N-acetylglucosamine--N-acetylmuramyl-(pentapeptide) pyrophosphoryl-undecaprenol N-acetylglucosamine transferase n=1 Tax=Chlorobium phaeobacteroides (strain DSM 266 / SMG 266 / 2430) TaxID=290317 RepID=MURG_CHLPD|nr:undecaprenyldiphospho-muramoylpentapeptide beta-N-acetylglucosaminyltransferase [Chlorobium phaeobacteroides]A1BJX8.1 RecName: Full=UDP-N-acetylglucosamine--N-acetylmuramyl-(pentapeptide) pyrophosphoryl-undecaprenol N-acetylglucosamine transferase; AltName: Full=Undecaprenyl-PP-MurNAc-pentapeptide-UDPGlcNAc GlcNAc transferase [Chlorobium phaeobacteroides DSM 266]ABL66705.1 UDP-N-acetylglucosamine--N-acetylmuramyl-(pentapeptide) pyrophosphoryl-undecaprenol N-acetylglucosamine transferase [Chlor
MNVLFAGGGTGGHLYPAVAMAGELQKRVPHVKLSFAGTEAGIEAREIPRLGYRLHLLSVRGLKRGRSLGALVDNLGVLADFIGAVRSALAIINSESPDVVVGTGGFVSAPLLLAAQMRGKKTLIQEQNAFPGVTTKLLSLFASEIHLSFEEAKPYIARKKEVYISGNPSRSFSAIDPDQARLRFGLAESLPTLLVFGGSRGARSINNAVLKWLDQITASANLIWQTGSLDYERIKAGVTSSARIWIGPYIENMGEAYAASELVVCRAGASTIAEVTNTAKPSVLVPYPHATGDHQRHNARALAENGAALLIDDEHLQAPESRQLVLDLLHDRTRRSAMSKAALLLAYPDATAALVDRIIRLAKS